MIRCPKTGRAIPTGKYVDFAAFRSSPVFFSRRIARSAAKCTSGLLKTHGSAIPNVPNAKASVSNKLRDAYRSPLIKLPAVQIISRIQLPSA